MNIEKTLQQLEARWVKEESKISDVTSLEKRKDQSLDNLARLMIKPMLVREEGR